MPTTYLLDTNTVTALANANAIALAHLSTLSNDDDIVTCFVIVGEWEFGILNAPSAARQAQIRAAGEPLFRSLTIYESTPTIAASYGVIHAYLRSIGQVIPTNDIWIAAVARTINATVVTTDAHFHRVPGLSIIDWTQP